MHITTICKSLDNFDIWNDWSKTGTKYDEVNNIKIWNNNDGKIDVSFFINILNDAGHKLQKIKHYETFKYFSKKPAIKTILHNHGYVVDEAFESDQLTYDHFKSHDTIIIKACTGTGKTTAITKNLYKFLNEPEHQDKKILTITDIINLSRQHMNSFKK